MSDALDFDDDSERGQRKASVGAVATYILRLWASQPGKLAWFGAFFALLRERIHGLGAALVALCFLSNGFGAVNAFLHPLPDPAHNPGMLQVGIFALPIVGLFVVWFLRDAVVTKSLLLFALAAFAAIAAIMSGLIPVVVSEAEGLWQRVAVAVLYAPLLTISASLWIRAAQPRIAQTE